MNRPPRAIRVAALTVYLALLLTVSLLPSGQDAPDDIRGWDEWIAPRLQDLLHLPAYAGVIVLAMLALPPACRTSRWALAVTAAAIAMGVALEYAQAYIPGRFASPLDAVTNSCGALLGLGALAASRVRPCELAPCECDVLMLVTSGGDDDPRVCMEARGLAETGREVLVIGWNRQDGRRSFTRRDGVAFLRLGPATRDGRGIWQAAFLLRYWRRVRRATTRLRPAVVHCHDLDTLPAGRRIARRAGAKLVFDAHENYPDMMADHLPAPAVTLLRRMERRAVGRCDAMITVGQLLAEHYRKLAAADVRVVGNWKDPSDYTLRDEDRAEMRQAMSLRNGKLAVSFIANLGPERRLTALLEAVEADKRFCCVIGGDGPQAPLARAAAERSPESVVYLGRVAPGDVPRLVAACDAVFYGYDADNLNARWSAPNKLFEAIAAGLPILTGNFGEIAHVVRTHGCGLLADTASTASLREALEVLADPGRRGEMSARAASLQGQFSRRAAWDALTALYDELDGRARP